MGEAHLRGVVSAQFEPVADLLEQNLESEAELGASLFIDIDGRSAVDVWGGFQDRARTTPWQEDTVANVWSVSKAIVNMAALMLVAHGELNLDDPVASYWPEFAHNGKDAVLVRHVLSHTSGVCGWNQPITIEDLYDTEKSTAMLAKQAPWWTPGTRSGYHMLTQGHLVGELIRRITGISLGEFVAEQVAAPLEADFQLGAKDSDWHRVADTLAPAQTSSFDHLPLDDVRRKTFTGPVLDASVANSSSWRSAVIGAANGHSNARSIGRILSTISLDGDVQGVRLLSPRAIDKIFSPQTEGLGRDLVLGIPVDFGVGFALAGPQTEAFIPAGRTCMWGGWGGSLVIMDTDRRMTVSFVMNKMGSANVGSETSAAYVQAIYDCLGADTDARDDAMAAFARMRETSDVG